MNGVRVLTVIDIEKRCEGDESCIPFYETGACQYPKRTFFSYLFVIDVVCGSYLGVYGSTC